MERRKSKKLGDPSVTTPRSRPTSGMLVNKRQNETDPKGIEVPNILAAAESQNPVSPPPGENKNVPEVKKVTREDFVLSMMENGTKDGIQSFIKQIAQMFLRGVPATKVLDELAKSISEEQEAQVEVASKMAALEAEAETLEKTLAQLQHDLEELKHMEEARSRGHSERSGDSHDPKHLQEDRSRKTKGASTVQKKKK